MNSKLSIIIDGDKSLFNSKVGVDKFKKSIKSSDTYNLEELSNKYINQEYKLEEVSKTDTELKLKLVIKNIKIIDKNLLKNKINQMKNERKSNYSTSYNTTIPAEIFREYNKLKNTKIPIPSPTELLKDPNAKDIIGLVLKNNLTINKNHPYFKYMTLMANHMGIVVEDIPENPEMAKLLEMMKSPEMKEMMKSGKMKEMMNTPEIKEMLKSSEVKESILVPANKINVDNDTDSDSE